METTTNQYTANRDGFTKSLWQEGLKKPVEINAALNTAVPFDVLIIGGGITGVTTALLLQKAGQKCILAEAHTIGFGTTGGTSAHLNTFFDATYAEVESDFNADAAKLFAKGGKASFELIKSLIDHYQIDCDFEYKDGYLFSENEKESKELEEILKASQEAGVEVVPATENGVPVAFDQSICFKGQGQFHPLKYLFALSKEFLNLGGIILENAPVRETSYEGQLHIAQAGTHKIKALSLVYATHIPPGINLLSFRCAPYRSYVLGLILKDENYPEALSYDMKDPYHYFRSHKIDGQQYLVLGGEDHKTGHGDPDEAFANLEAYARKHYDIEKISYKWSAQYYIPVDGLPYIGPMASGAANTYVASGFNGNGMMLGTLSAKIISDQILEIDNPWSELFSPSRIKPVAGFTDFVKENADVVYHFIADRFSAEELASVKELQPDQGLLAEFQGKMVAIYKSKSGAVTALNPTCTHAGCKVKFNTVEKTWDCPCHGGRYDTNGKVLTGPPVKDLEKIDFT